MKAKQDPSQQLLLSLFTYKDGMLFGKYKRSQRKPGERAGALNKDGYRTICIDRKAFLEHRLIWIMFNGPIPENMHVDHRNTVKNDNKIENLRLATNAQNKANAPIMSSNTSGFKGVSKQVIGNTSKWKAEIRVNYKSIYLGLFDTPELASEAYKTASIKYHQIEQLQ